VTASPDRDPIDRLLDTGRQAFARGNYSQAENDLRRAVAEAGVNGASSAQMFLAVGDLGSVLLSQGRYAEAETCFDRAMAILKSNDSLDRSQLPVLLGNLGKLYQQTGRYPRSESALREALRLGRQLLAARPLYISDLYNNLGVLHFAMGNRKQAERDFRKAMALADEAGSDDSHRSSILSNLATLYFTQQKWSLAEETLLHSINAVEQSRGLEHPDLCPLLENAGFIYLQKRELLQAETMLRRSLAIRQKRFGPESAYTAASEARLANVLAANGSYEEAGRLYAEALKTQEQVLGLQAPDVVKSLEGFANVLRQTHNEDLAKNLEARAESIRLNLAYTISVKDMRH
jgi:tetratricopeptide (TPR) repeat protein